MIYRHDRSQIKIRTQILLGALFALLLLFFIKSGRAQKFLMPTALRVYAPLFSFKKIIFSGAENLILNFREKKALEKKIKELQGSVNELEARTMITETLRKENKIFKDFLDLKINEKFFIANIIYSSRPFLDTFTINAGENSGIRKGMEVVAFSDIFLGKINLVSSDSSMVELISSPGVLTDAILEESGIRVSLVGRGGGNLMVKLPRSFEVKIGERVAAFSPTPFFIGVVEDIKKDNTKPMQEILLRLPVNLLKLNYVFIVKPH